MVKTPGALGSPLSTAIFAPLGSEAGPSAHLMSSAANTRCSAAAALAVSEEGVVAGVAATARSASAIRYWRFMEDLLDGYETRSRNHRTSPLPSGTYGREDRPVTAPIQLQTERLRLVAGTESMIQAELMDRVAMARLLGVAVPGTWPPPLNDDGSMRYFLRFAREHPEGIGFGCWYWMRDGDHDGRGGTSDGGGLLLIGNGGCRGLPCEDGIVEVRESVVEA